MAKRKFKFKINGDTMTTIVVSSLILCVIFITVGFIFAWFDKDVSTIVDSSLRVFGTELGICGVMTIFQRWIDKQERRAEIRNEEREDLNGESY